VPRWTRDEQNAIRADAFRWLAEQMQAGKPSFTRQELAEYRFDGVRIPLVDQYGRGIRNPADFEATLSISTSASSRRNPYADEDLDGGMVRYDYRRGEGGDNIKLRRAAEFRVPLIYFKQIREAGPLVPVFPVYLIDDPVNRVVNVAMDEVLLFLSDPMHPSDLERRYVDRTVRARLHQPVFRARVISAYRTRCSICNLRHVELLDAAHITPDGAPNGSAHVSNGVSLCKIHHAAYDQDLVGITPDYEVRVDEALLREVDGPMLRHGLQDMHGRRLELPSEKADWPDRDRLAERFAQFAA